MIRSSQWSLRPNQRGRRRSTAPGVDEERTTPAPSRMGLSSASRTSSAPLPRASSSTEELFAPPFAIAEPGEESAAATPTPSSSSEVSTLAATPAAGLPAASGTQVQSLPPPWAERPSQRAEVRKPVHIGIELLHRTRGGPEFAVGADLSPAGAYILSDDVLAPQERLLIRFRLPWADDEYSFLGEVVRVQPVRADELGAHYGYGLQFLDVMPSEGARLREELRDLPPAVDWTSASN